MKSMQTNLIYRCLFSQCSSQLPSIHSLLSHMRLFHNSEKNACLRCCIGKCEKLYTTSDSYRKHVEREHECELKYGLQYSAGTKKTSSSLTNSIPMPGANCQTEDENTMEELDMGQILQILTKSVSLFALRIREENVLPKSTSTSILNGMSSLFDTFFEHFRKFVVARLEANGIDISLDPSFHSLLNDSEIIQDVWLNVNSDAKLKRFCLTHLNLIEPIKAQLGFDEVTGKEHFFQYISITKSLEHYIQHEDVWASINRNMMRKSDTLYDYTDGSAFTEHPFFSLHPEALRLNLYVDDLGLCNPLGGAKKKHSITAVYFQIGNLEQKHLSTMQSIHVVAIANAVLVKKYVLSAVFSKIADEISLLESQGIKHTWFESLRQKFKDNRRKLTDEKQVKQMKAKYGYRCKARRSRANPHDLTETPRSKIPRFDFMEADDGEDDRSIACHVEAMKRQLSRGNNCDWDLVADRMVRTHAARRELVNSGSKTNEILESYPGLKDQNQIHAEFLRMTRVNLKESIGQFWTAPRVDTAIRMLGTDKVVYDIAKKASETNVVDDKRCLVLEVLPRLFGERVQCWSLDVATEKIADVDCTNLTVYPTVVSSVDGLFIFFERVQMCKCNDMLEAVATIVMMYYVFDVQYATELANTLNFLDAFVGKIDKKTKIRPVVQRKVNILLS